MRKKLTHPRGVMVVVVICCLLLFDVSGLWEWKWWWENVLNFGENLKESSIM